MRLLTARSDGEGEGGTRSAEVESSWGDDGQSETAGRAAGGEVFWHATTPPGSPVLVLCSRRRRSGSVCRDGREAAAHRRKERRAGRARAHARWSAPSALARTGDEAGSGRQPAAAAARTSATQAARPTRSESSASRLAKRGTSR
eukprot:scaffold101376_cov28-Tisochrysis_lutea.AAC.1